MSGPGYQEGGEPLWWWKVAQHLDGAQSALSNAMAHNVDDPSLAFALYHRIREGQAILLEIFRAKGLLPGQSSVRIETPIQRPPTSAPEAPTGVLLPFPSPHFPSPAGVEPAVPTPAGDQQPAVPVVEPAVLESDQGSPASEPVQTDTSSEAAHSPAAVDVMEVPAAPAEAPPADPGAGA